MVNKKDELIDILEKCIKHMTVHKYESCELYNKAKKLIKEHHDSKAI